MLKHNILLRIKLSLEWQHFILQSKLPASIFSPWHLWNDLPYCMLMKDFNTCLWINSQIILNWRSNSTVTCTDGYFLHYRADTKQDEQVIERDWDKRDCEIMSFNVLWIEQMNSCVSDSVQTAWMLRSYPTDRIQGQADLHTGYMCLNKMLIWPKRAKMLNDVTPNYALYLSFLKTPLSV